MNIYDGVKQIKNYSEELLKAIKESKDILIIGDYDCDGICSSLIMEKIVSKNNENVKVKIPDRYCDGYGIPNIDKLKLHKGTLVITVDNGIEQSEKIDEIYKRTGVKPFVIDHHTYSKDNVSKNCKYLDFHEKNENNAPDYCATGLATMIATCSFVNDLDEKELNMIKTLGMIGTIGDVVKVRNETDYNKAIILNGYDSVKDANLNNFDMRLGLFLDKCGLLDKQYITTQSIQFDVVPVINALSRIEMNGGQKTFDILNKGNLEDLDVLFNANKQRKELVKKAMNDKEILNQIGYDAPNIIYARNLCEGCCGLVAQQIVDMTGYPCLVCTDKLLEKGKLVGSGRNMEGFSSLYNSMEKVKCESLKFGGHESACGFSLDKDDFLKLKSTFKTSKEREIEHVYADLSDVNTCEKLMKLEPFGIDNPMPELLLKGIVSDKTSFKDENMAKFSISEGIEAITYKDGKKFKNGDTVVLRGQIGIHEYIGYNRHDINLQINITDIGKSKTRDIEDKEVEMVKE